MTLVELKFKFRNEDDGDSIKLNRPRPTSFRMMYHRDATTAPDAHTSDE